MKRGNIVAVAIQGDFGKARPALVVQSDLFTEHPGVALPPMSSETVDAPLTRIKVIPSEQNPESLARAVADRRRQDVHGAPRENRQHHRPPRRRNHGRGQSRDARVSGFSLTGGVQTTAMMAGRRSTRKGHVTDRQFGQAGSHQSAPDWLIVAGATSPPARKISPFQCRALDRRRAALAKIYRRFLCVISCTCKRGLTARQSEETA